MLAFERFSGGDSRAIWERLPNATRNGKPFRRENEYEVTKHTPRLRYTEDDAETNLLLDGIVAAGVRFADVSRVVKPKPPRPSPDFKLTLADGATVFVECTRAGDSGVIRDEDNFPLMEARMNEWLANTPRVAERLAGRYIAFLPGKMPRANREEEYISEMQRFVEDERLEDYGSVNAASVPRAYAVLSECGTRVYSRPSLYSHVVVQIPARWTGGQGEALQFALQAVANKRAKIYDGYRPIWLAVGIANLQWPVDDIFDALAATIADISPFASVFFCNSNASLRVRAVTE